MTTTTVQIGRTVLREAYASEEGVANDGSRELSLSAQEASPPLTTAALRAKHSALMGLRGRIVPVVFQTKTSLSGFYLVEAVGGGLTSYEGEVESTRWEADLRRLGDGGSAEVESRLLSGTRLTDHAVTPARWHAPARGATYYFTGDAEASPLDRVGSEGTVTVYTAVPEGSARWGVAPEDYLNGAALLEVDGEVTEGFSVPNSPEGWRLSNELLRLEALDGKLLVSTFAGGGWREKAYAVTVSGAKVSGAWSHLAVLRNDPEEVVIRLERPQTGGKLALDLSLRRGALAASCFVQRHASATLGFQRDVSEAASAITGGLVASATSDQVRYVIGSAKTFTADLAVGGLAKASVRTLDLFVGAEPRPGGAAPQTGDGAADLVAQYLGAPAETTKVVRR